MNIGDKIQQLRKANNLSQEQLASQLDVSRQAVSKWELNESIPDTDKIIFLSKVFSVSTDYLLLDQNESFNGDSSANSASLDKQRVRSMLLAAIIISVMGLLISIGSLSFFDSQVGFLFGLAIQVLAVVFFEMSVHGVHPEIYVSARKRFYLMNVWLLLYSPSAIITSYVLRHLPSVDELLWRYGYLIVYIMSAIILSIFILKISEKK